MNGKGTMSYLSNTFCIAEEAAAPKNITNKTASSPFGKSMESDIEYQQPENVKPESLPSEVKLSKKTELDKKPLVTTQLQVENESKFQPLVASHSLQHRQTRSNQQVNGDIENMYKSPGDLQDKEVYTTLSFWDFAGDEEFYHTHQTFLSPDSIYIVVTKLNEAGEKNARGKVNMIFDILHYFYFCLKNIVIYNRFKVGLLSMNVNLTFYRPTLHALL